MYLPGQEGRPDPESSHVLAPPRGGGDGERRRRGEAPATSRGGGGGGGRARKYYEDPPMRPKRDPTCYVDGVRDVTAGSARDGGDGPRPRRDPAFYGDDDGGGDRDGRHRGHSRDAAAAPCWTVCDDEDGRGGRDGRGRGQSRDAGGPERRRGRDPT